MIEEMQIDTSAIVSEKYNLSYEEMLNELLFFYQPFDIKEKYNYDINDDNFEELEKVFEKHINENSEYVEIQDLVNNYANNMILLDTPDGFKQVSDFYIKNEIECLEFKTKDFYTKCSYEHEFEKDENLNWVLSKNLNIGDKIFTRNGFQEITEINNLGKSIVYDLRVSYIHRRYFSGNGISSHNCGKSFLCYSLVKEAQKNGWNTIYIDTEQSIQLEQLPGYGVNVSSEKFMLIRSNIVEDVIKILAQVIDELKNAKMGGMEIPKTMIILDSVGMMASRKESEDAKSGSEKVDMSRAKKLASMFRIISGDLGYLNIPMVCTNHVYEEMTMFPKKIMKGGCLVEDSLVLMHDGSYKKIQDIVEGDYVQTLENQQLVKDVYKFDDKVLYEVELEDGTVIKCSENHRFLIGDDYEDENSWISVKDIVDSDTKEIYRVKS